MATKHKSTIRGASGAKGTPDPRVLGYVPLVPMIAEHVCQQAAHSLNLGNLAMDGLVGLLETATIDTPQSGIPIGIYVKHLIRGAILDGLLSDTAPFAASPAFFFIRLERRVARAAMFHMP